MNRKVLQLNSQDNVLVALQNLAQGDSIAFADRTYSLASAIPAKHKFAIRDLAAGDPILMYGVVVGKAVEPIGKGNLLTTRNVRHDASAFHEKAEEFRWTSPDVSRWTGKKFLGYRRSDGQVGTRNYWLVIPLVFCENRNIGILRQAFEEELGLAPPQVYRRQVAELARLYQQGKSAEIGAVAFKSFRKCGRNQVPHARRRLRRHARRFQQPLRTARRLHSPSQRRRSHDPQPRLPARANCHPARRNSQARSELFKAPGDFRAAADRLGRNHA